MLTDKEERARIEQEGKHFVAQCKGSAVGKGISKYLDLLAQYELERCASSENVEQIRQAQGAYKALKKVGEMFASSPAGSKQ